jgi:exodeoxyribonuclease VII small subunit
MSQDNSHDKQKILASIANLSFEEALAELESIVKTLENGTQNLENAIQAYQRGVALKERCERKLQEATLQLQKIIPKEDGTITAEDVEL